MKNKKCNCGYDHTFGEDEDIPVEHDRCPNCDRNIYDLPPAKYLGVDAWTPPKIEHLKPTIYGWTVSWPGGFLLEPETDLGCYCYINARHGVTIKKGAKLGSYVSVYSDDTIGGHSGPVVIGENVFVGSHSLILPGVEIGPNLVLPAYSLVKKSILTQEDLDIFLILNKRPAFGGLL